MKYSLKRNGALLVSLLNQTRSHISLYACSDAAPFILQCCAFSLCKGEILPLLSLLFHFLSVLSSTLLTSPLILFHLLMFNSILLYSAPFQSILFHSLPPHYMICSILLPSVLFCITPCCSISSSLLPSVSAVFHCSNYPPHFPISFFFPISYCVQSSSHLLCLLCSTQACSALFH